MVTKSFCHGFTLVEAIISMLIIAMVTLCAIPVLTKKKPEIEKVSLRGQYACFVDDGTYGHNGKLMEWYFDERTPRTTNPVLVELDGCKLKLDKRPSGYYILATGAGGTDISAQAKAQYVTAISDQLDIELGRINALYSPDTTINTGSSAEMVAAGAKALYSASGVLPDNIKTCRLVEAPYDYATNSYKTETKIRINGCSSALSDDTSQNTPTLIPFKPCPNPRQDCISFEGFSGTANFDNLSQSLRDKISNANANYYHATGKVNGDDTSFNLAFDFIDSTFTHPLNELGFKNNTTNVPVMAPKSKMTKLIELISVRRQSELTRFLARMNPGGRNKNGAVLILW